MSAGAFINSKYESNSGEIYKIRLQTETTELTIGGIANAAPTGAITAEVSALARGNKRTIGMVARTITLKFTGAAPTNYLGTNVVVPVLNPTTFDDYTTPAGKTGTYLGSAVEVVGQSAERKR